MRRLIALALTVPMLMLSLATGTANAATVKGSFEYHVGDALIQGLGFPAGNQAVAENGDVVTIIATGTFDTVTHTATGSGTFAHHMLANGQTITGTLAITGLISFQSYGNATPQGLPASFFGGKLVLSMLATPDIAPSVHLPALLTIQCELGNPVPSSVEGVRVNVQDVINFNKSVPESGANIYIQQ